MELVLNFSPKGAHAHDREERVYIVWPSVAWRIVAPLPGDRKINMFQKAVLNLCRSATYSVPEIESILHLHPQLIDTIGKELMGFGWVNPETWRPTDKGLAILSDEEPAMDSLVTGWVFQEPSTGELWPFFSRQLQLQETAAHPEQKRVSLWLGSAEKPRKIPAWQLDPRTSPECPNSKAILAAIRRFRKREKLKGSMRFIASSLDEPLSGGSPELLSRIAFISDLPQHVGLVTYGYLPGEGGFPPQICDPFGFGSHEEMWPRLGRLAQQDEAASNARRDLLNLANAHNAPALEELLQSERQAAEAYLTARLSLDIRGYSAVFAHLVSVQHHISLAIAMGGDPQGHLEPAMGSCRKTLEALLKEVARRSPLTGVYQHLTGEHKFDRDNVEKIASELGFQCPIPTKIRDSIQSGGATRKRVEDIGRDLKEIYSLNAAIVATLLACSKDGNHPFRLGAKRDPSMLHKMIDIIDLGNPASHDNSHNPKTKAFTVADATKARDLTIEVAACMLNLPIQTI